MLFANGKINTYKKQTGKIRSTSLPLLIGQMLPTDANYNFKGIIDEIRIYDFGLNPTEIEKLYHQSIASKVNSISLAGSIKIYPNPGNHTLFIDDSLLNEEMTFITISNMMGVQMREIVVKNKTKSSLDISGLSAGNYIIQFKNLRKEIIQSIQFIKS
jgi:hypothetical protein